ncbi:MAG TPA: ABC transporter permease [Candidatus Sulfotelmatobacter sp.]|nr:ABC transporter permease [Candidatus Sulfotelmatobacter sp.]
MTVVAQRPSVSESLESFPELPRTIIRPSRGWVSLRLPELWHYRELLVFLAWRDVKVRYKQTALGVVWAVLQPLLGMVVFTVFFGRLAKVPSDGIPYPLFSYSALLAWQLFAYSLTESSNSVVANERLITKVYFPRLVIPMASILAGLVDFAIGFVLLIGLMAYYGVHPGWGVLTLPLFIVFEVATALGVGLWLSALNVQFRDVRYTVPFIAQFWMFASPVVYSSTLVPARWRPWYGLNPMAGVVEGFRWALLGKQPAPGLMFAVSSVVVAALLVSGLFYYRRMEKNFADVV